LLRTNNNETKVNIDNIYYKININTFSKSDDIDNGLKMNDVSRIQLKLAKEVFFDIYKLNRNTGSFILVDEATNNTVAAGLVHTINA